MILAFFLLGLTTISKVKSKHFGTFSQIEWRGGFESNTIAEEYSIVSAADSWSIVSSGAGLTPQCGNKFGKVTLKPADTCCGDNHNRAELEYQPTAMQGTTGYFGWSMAHDTTLPLASTTHGQELVYWETRGAYFQTLGFLNSPSKTNSLEFRTRFNGNPPDTYFPSGRGGMEFTSGKWYDFVMEIHWDGTEENGTPKGWVKMWRDGVVVVPKTFHKTLNGNAESFMHIGIFRLFREYTTSETMYFDCLVYSKGFSLEGCYDDDTPCVIDAPNSSPVAAVTAAPNSSPVAAAPNSSPIAADAPASTDENCACGMPQAWCAGTFDEKILYGNADCQEAGFTITNNWLSKGTCKDEKYLPDMKYGCKEYYCATGSCNSNESCEPSNTQTWGEAQYTCQPTSAAYTATLHFLPIIIGFVFFWISHI